MLTASVGHGMGTNENITVSVRDAQTTKPVQTGFVMVEEWTQSLTRTLTYPLQHKLEIQGPVRLLMLSDNGSVKVPGDGFKSMTGSVLAPGYEGGLFRIDWDNDRLRAVISVQTDTGLAPRTQSVQKTLTIELNNVRDMPDLWFESIDKSFSSYSKYLKWMNKGDEKYRELSSTEKNEIRSQSENQVNKFSTKYAETHPTKVEALESGLDELKSRL